ncbi:Ion transport protein [Chitinivibrio alkaliphilus ACht1]|uniref:Ion transport protein n=1 Tax=Chitinivibrio alkaliphilus ACht1 TaxID=1313304 RepID=U7D581_9BACT|nr:Ion transport protein [Chitinivibrio alkaliphilus ACht1]
MFTIEYLVRIWTANIHPAYKKPLWGNLKFAATPLLIIDLLAILPFYLPFLGVDLRLLRVFRIHRLLRLFKIARYSTALSHITSVFRDKKEELFTALFFTFLLLVLTATLMYHIENPAQPEVFSSIPQTIWWGVAALTTVGYGDIYPITPQGQILGAIIAIIGIGIFALPAGILASGFSE